MNKIGYITIYSALDRTSKINSIEPKVCTLAKEIFEIISNKQEYKKIRIERAVYRTYVRQRALLSYTLKALPSNYLGMSG